MDKTLKIKISVDKDTGAVSVIGKEFDELDDKISQNNKGITALTANLKVLTGSVVGIYALKEALSAVASSGLEYNKSMESLGDGLTALNAALSTNVTSTGRTIDINEKYAIAARETVDVMAKLNAINAETPHGLEQTVQIYKSMYSTMSSLGVSTEQMIDLTKKVSIAAGSAGIEFQQLLSGIDGLATGTVEVSSEFGRFLKSIGLSNEELKKSSNIYETINAKIKDFRANQESFEVAMSNASNSFSQFAGLISKPLFDTLKVGLVETGKLFDGLSEKINRAGKQSKKREEFELIKEIEDASEAFVIAQKALATANNGGFGDEYLTKTINQANKTKDALDALTESYIKLYGESSSEKLVKSKKSDEPYDMSDFEQMGFKIGQEWEKKQEEIRKKSSEKAKKAKDDELKHSHDVAQKQLSMIQKLTDEKTKLSEDYTKSVNDLNDKSRTYFLDGLGKEAEETFTHYENLKTQFASIAGSSETLTSMQSKAIEDINKKQEEQNKLFAKNALLDSITSSTSAMERMLEIQIELASSGMDWASGLSGQAAAISEVDKTFKKLHVSKLKNDKEDLKAQEVYAKKFLMANGDVIKEKEALAEFDATQSVLREQEMNSYIGAFGNLAGAVSQYAKEGSKAAEAAEIAQRSLAVVQAVQAVIKAWGDPFPLNLITVPATVAATGALLASIGESGASGGTSYSPQEVGKFNIEAEYNPALDKMDRQIELLEAIEKNGSASSIAVSKAGVTFERDYALFVNDKMSQLHSVLKAGWGANPNGDTSRKNTESTLEEYLGFNLADSKNSSNEYRINQGTLSESYNFMRLIEAANTDLIKSTDWGVLFDKDWKKAGSPGAMLNVRIAEFTNEFQEMLGSYTMSLLDEMDKLKDAKENFKEYFDEITGTSYYETQKLTQAFSEVDKLRGSKSVADYLKDEIQNIEGLQSYLTQDKLNVLMTEDPTNLKAQLDILKDLENQFGLTFEGGAREALNYLESIKLVSETMAKSRENIKSFLDSLKTPEMLASDMASSLGVNVAGSVEELSALFTSLSNDMDGLSDADLELLNANKALLENTDEYQKEIDGLNITLDDVTSNISTLENAFGSVSSTIEKLEGATSTSEQNLKSFYDAMEEAQVLSESKNYKEYAKAIQDLTETSSVLFNKDAFATSFDQEFAQLVALHQFKNLESVTLEEIDYLKLIEENTRDEVEILTEALGQLGANISSSLLAQSSALKEIATASNSTSSPDYITSLVEGAYITVLGREAEQGGLDYWSTQVKAGNIAINDINKAIALGALGEGDVKAASAYLEVHGSHYDGLSYVPFDGYRAELHKGERVLTANDNGLIGAIVEELQALRAEVRSSRADSNRLQSEISQNTKQSRFIS